MNITLENIFVNYILMYYINCKYIIHNIKIDVSKREQQVAGTID
jgi:hypothetical protein